MDNKDNKKPLLTKDKKGKDDPDITADIENQVQKPTKPAEKSGDNKNSAKNAGTTWGDSDTIKDYGVFYAVRFMLPILCKGGWVVKMQLLLTLLLTVGAKVLAVLHPIVLKYIIDTMTAGQPAYYLILLYIGVRLASEACNLSREITFASISASAEVYIADKVYNHIQNQSLNFHLNRQTGKIVRICSKGSQSFASILRYALFVIGPLFLEVGLVCLSIGFMFKYYFFILIIVSITAYIVDTYYVTEWRAKYFKRMNLKDNAYVQKATDSLLNFETVKYFNAEKHEEERYFKALQEYKTENVAVTNSMVMLNVSQSFLLFVGLILNLMLAAYMVETSTFRVGDFVLLNTYILQVYQPLFFLGSFWRWIRQAMVDVEQIFEILEVNDTIEEPKKPKSLVKGDGKIEFKNVSFAYEKNTDKMIIDNLTFTVEPGTSVAIVGATGAGKSTIMRLLYRFYDINEGTILVDGQDISQLRIKDLRSKIGIVPQDTVLFNDTIKYNIAYGGVSDPGFKEMMLDQNRQDQFMEKLISVATKAQIINFINSKEDGFDVLVGERGLKLSGGEKQRVSIARALLKHTPIMLFDEATSALDTATEKEIQAAINNVSKNATTLMIAHRLSTIQGCDKIIVLKNGVICEEGTHEKLLEKDGEYKYLWNKQDKKENKELAQPQNQATEGQTKED